MNRSVTRELKPWVALSNKELERAQREHNRSIWNAWVYESRPMSIEDIDRARAYQAEFDARRQ